MLCVIRESPMNGRKDSPGTFISDTLSLFLTRGGDMASTWVAKPEVHAEDVTILVKNVANVIVANDETYALAA